MSSSTSIEDLPPEMISELFEYLHLKDLCACSLVNKRWNSIYSNFKMQRLAAISYEYDYHEIFRWYHTNQPIQEEERCSPTMFVRLVEKPLLSNLKHLALAGACFKLDLNKLNRFSQLVQLEISYYLVGEVHLNLPRLKVLAIHEWNYCDLSIDCPLLSTLVYCERKEGATLLKVKHPETIRNLETNMIGEKLTPFKGVECLMTRRYQMISSATLLSLPKLKEFRYIQDISNLFQDELRYGLGTVNGLKRTLNEFMAEAKKLRGNDFQFAFSGFQLSNMKVDQIDFAAQVFEVHGRRREYVSNESIYMKNYHLIEPGALHYIRNVDYTDLLSHVTGEFPRCFSQKFTDIKEVQVTDRIEDADQFLWFLKSLRFLKSLSLDETELGQEFYDQLPESAPSLRNLELEERHCEDGLQLNFNFIGRLPRLSDLDIDQNLCVESLPSLVRWISKLEDVQFNVQSGQKRFEIRKEMRLAEWKIWKNCTVVFKTRNPEEIVHFFESLPNKGQNKKRK